MIAHCAKDQLITLLEIWEILTLVYISINYGNFELTAHFHIHTKFWKWDLLTCASSTSIPGWITNTWYGTLNTSCVNNYSYAKSKMVLINSCFWSIFHERHTHSLSNFEIRRDVTCGRLHASLQITLKCVSFAANPYTTHAFTSHLISKLDRI